MEQAAQLNMREEYVAMRIALRCIYRIVGGTERVKRPRLSIGIKQSIGRIARLESLKDSVRERFVEVDAGFSAGFQWREIDTTFESRILTGTVINFRHIEPVSCRCE